MNIYKSVDMHFGLGHTFDLHDTSVVKNSGPESVIAVIHQCRARTIPPNPTATSDHPVDWSRITSRLSIKLNHLACSRPPFQTRDVQL
jgi:hypothetical protein